MDFSHIKLDKFKQSNAAEFQVLGKCIQDFCGEKKFPIALFLNYPIEKIKDAFLIAEKRNVRSLKYLVGIVKRL